MAQNIDIVISAKDTATKSINEAKNAIKWLSSSVEQMKGIAWTAFSAMKTGALALWTAIWGLWAFGVKAGADMEQVNIAFKTLYGSSDQARKTLEQLADFAAKTPFEFPELADSALKLQNIAGISKDQLIPTLTSLGDIASSQWKSIDQMTEAFNDAVVWEFERLKEFWIRASQEWDRVTFTYKWQTTVVQKNNEAIADYITKLWQAQWVAGSMDAQSGTLNWRLSTMKDNFKFLAMDIVGVSKAGEIMKGWFFDLISQAINSLWSLMETYKPQMMEFFKKIWEIAVKVAKIASEFWLKFGEDITQIWETIQKWFWESSPVAMEFFLETLKNVLFLAWIFLKWLNEILKWEFFEVWKTWFEEFAFWFSEVWTWIKQSIWEIVDTMVNYVNSKINSMVEFITEKIEWLRNKVNEAKEFVNSIMANVNKASWSFVQTFSIQWVSNAIEWARAEWWPVSSGKTYMVWEKWPELFVPKTNGTIMPNGTPSPTININMWGMTVNNRWDADYFVEKIRSTFIRELQLSKLGIN